MREVVPELTRSDGSGDTYALSSRLYRITRTLIKLSEKLSQA